MNKLLHEEDGSFYDADGDEVFPRCKLEEAGGKCPKVNPDGSYKDCNTCPELYWSYEAPKEEE